MSISTVAVIGGGITGLSAAYHLEKLGVKDVVLFEATSRLGGKISTVIEDGFRVDCGPDSIFTRRPETMDLFRELDLEAELIQPSCRGFSILLDGQLREVPPGLTRIGAIDNESLEGFAFLSSEAKTHIRGEEDVPRRRDVGDESVSSFFSRRYGEEYSLNIAEPIFAGTHGGNSAQLSMQSLYPTYVEQEKVHGSLTAAAREGSKLPTMSFVSFKSGAQELVDAFQKKIFATQVLNEAVQALEHSGSQWLVNGRSFESLIVSVPAHGAAALLKSISPHASKLLEEIRAATSTIVTFGFERLEGRERLHGTGFLVPEGSGSEVSGATWSSQKWVCRADPPRTLVRVFLRGEPDSPLKTAEECLKRVVQIGQSPSYSRVDVWRQGLPQYLVGHSQLVKRIESELEEFRTVKLAGQSYRGVGIPDCIAQGREAAEFLMRA